MQVQTKRTKRKLVLFDELQFKSKDDTCTIWTGAKGTYVFKRIQDTKVNRPICQVYLDRKYLTGLFKTAKNDIYSGDIKVSDEKKIYLIFKVVDQKKIEIYEKKSANFS